MGWGSKNFQAIFWYVLVLVAFIFIGLQYIIFVILYYIKLYYIILNYIVLYCIILYYIISYDSLFYCVTSSTMFHYIIPYLIYNYVINLISKISTFLQLLRVEAFHTNSLRWRTRWSLVGPTSTLPLQGGHGTHGTLRGLRDATHPLWILW